MSDLSEHYERKMPTAAQIRAANHFSQNCDSADLAPVQNAHSWMTSALSAGDDTLPAPPAAQQPAATTAMRETTASTAPAHTQPAPQQQRRQPVPGDFIGLPSSPAVRAFMLAGGTCRISPGGYYAAG